MNFAVVQFPGSNCDQDCVAAINGLDGLRAEYVWHKETSFGDFDAIVLPVAHGEGCFFADPQTLSELNANEQVILRYADEQGHIVPEANPNGSIENIAGICNRERNVFGLMPHPDRAWDARLGSADGAKIFLSMMETIRASRSPNRPERVRQVA